jgi:hypothetical protein
MRALFIDAEYIPPQVLLWPGAHPSAMRVVCHWIFSKLFS